MEKIIVFIFILIILLQEFRLKYIFDKLKLLEESCLELANILESQSNALRETIALMRSHRNYQDQLDKMFDEIVHKDFTSSANTDNTQN